MARARHQKSGRQTDNSGEKALQELQWFRSFADLQPTLGIADIRHGGNPPDIECTIDQGTIGVELTRLFFPHHQGPSPQAYETNREKLEAQLAKEHSKRGLPPSRISVLLYPSATIQQEIDRKRLCGELVSFIADRVPPGHGLLSFEEHQLTNSLQTEGVHSISIFRSASVTDVQWNIPPVGFLPDFQPDSIQEKISKKSGSKWISGETKFKAKWLLILTGTKGIHSMIEISKEILSRTYTSSFDRIFVLNTVARRVYELETRKTPNVV